MDIKGKDGTGAHTQRRLGEDLYIDQGRDREDPEIDGTDTERNGDTWVLKHLLATPVGMNNGRQT